MFLRAQSLGSGEPAAPDCTNAVASPEFVNAQKKRKKFSSISVLGVTDPNGDVPTITITGIHQDEPTGAKPDASGVGQSRAKVRREAAPNGDGRIYRVAFTAEDNQGE